VKDVEKHTTQSNICITLSNTWNI